MTAEGAKRLFWATGLPEVYVYSRRMEPKSGPAGPDRREQRQKER